MQNILKNKITWIAVGAVLLLVFAYYFFKDEDEKSSGDTLEAQRKLDLEKEKALQDALLKEQEQPKVDTSSMTIEERLDYEAKKAEEKAKIDEYNQLVSDFFDLFGKTPAQAGLSSIDSIKRQIDKQKQLLASLKSYTDLTGDWDYSDNDFTTIESVELAKKKYTEDLAKEEAWVKRKQHLNGWAKTLSKDQNPFIGRDYYQGRAAWVGTASDAANGYIYSQFQELTELVNSDYVSAFYLNYMISIPGAPFNKLVKWWTDGGNGAGWAAWGNAWAGYASFISDAEARGINLSNIDKFGNIVLGGKIYKSFKM